MDWLERNCPLCDSKKRLVSGRISSSIPAESLKWNEAKSYFIGLRKEQIFFSYHRCANCKLLYCPVYFSEEHLSILYSEMPDNFMGEDKDTVSRTQSSYSHWIIKNSTLREIKYLEIGSDAGLVTREIVKLGKVSAVTVIEPNKAIHPELITNVGHLTDLTILEYIEEISNSMFNLIAGVHVYDHLLDPKKDLLKLRQISEPEGLFAVVVHNEHSSIRRILAKKWPPFCLQHPQLYNPGTLREILRITGWEMFKNSKTTNWYHLDHFAKMGAGVLGINDKWSALLPHLEFPIRLGNTIAIARAANYNVE